MKKMVITLFFLLIIAGSLNAEQVFEAWVNRYNGLGNSHDRPTSMVVDNYGNTYITGSEGYDSGIDEDIATVKYDTNGVQQWVQRYDGPAGKYDLGTDIAIDNQCNVYVTGESVGTDNKMNYVTIKYDTDGILQWVARYKADRDAYPRAIDVDSTGNVYITGMSYRSDTGFDCTTVKYDPNGVELWVDIYNGSASLADSGADLIIDEFDNIYVGGYQDGLYSGFNGWLAADYLTIKYAPDKTILWLKSYAGLGVEMITDIALDNSNNIYVTGGRTIKYDTNGVELWVNDSFAGSRQAIDVDMEGNVYICGTIYTESLKNNYITGKYDLDGILVWTKQYNGPRNDIDSAYGICADKYGNVFVTGESMGIGTGFDCATVKYDTNGIQKWVQRYNGPSNSADWGRTVGIDHMGNVYVTGASISSAGYDYATIKYYCNTAPVAIVGQNQTVYVCDEDELASVTLGGAGSLDEDGDELDYYWSWIIDSNLFEANGVSPTIQLPIGEHEIELTVDDGKDESEPNYCTINVVGPVKAKLFCMPQMLNTKMRYGIVMAMICLPKGITPADIDSNEPLTFIPGNVESKRQFVFQRQQQTWIIASFDRGGCMDNLSIGINKIKVTGHLKSGQCYYGDSYIFVFKPKPFRWPWLLR